MAFASALATCRTITSIDLSSNQLCGIDSSTPHSSEVYTKSGIKALASALATCRTITSMDLSNNQLISGEYDEEKEEFFITSSIEALTKMIVEHGVLRKLNLLGNEEGGEEGYPSTERKEDLRVLLSTAKDCGITSLSGFEEGQSVGDLSGRNLEVIDLLLVAWDYIHGPVEQSAD